MSNESFHITQNTIEEIVLRKMKRNQIPERKSEKTSQVENLNLSGAKLRLCVHVTGVNGLSAACCAVTHDQLNVPIYARQKLYTR